MLGGAMSRLIFHVGRREDGWAFGLPLASERALRARFPDAQPAERIFMAHPTMDTYQKAHADLWSQMATLLTGLTARQLADLGGWVFIDPVAGEVLGEGPTAERAA